MAANLYTQQEKNVYKTWILMASFLVLIIVIGWFISLYYNSSIILYIAIGFALFMNFFSYWFSHRVVLKLTGAKKVKRDEYFDLYNSVENLSITAGLPMPQVYMVNDNVPNAFATGRDKNHSVVVVTSGLLKILDKVELEGVIAHELSHIGNRDILLQTVIVTLVGFITILSDIFIRSQLYGGRRNNNSDSGKIGIFILIAGFVLMILSPIIAILIQLAISRKREFLADASAAMLTRYPDGLASALEKISSYSGPKMKKVSHATAHLFISDPFKSGVEKDGHLQKQSFLTKIFATHPPIKKRVDMLRGLEI